MLIEIAYLIFENIGLEQRPYAGKDRQFQQRNSPTKYVRILAGKARYVKPVC